MTVPFLGEPKAHDLVVVTNTTGWGGTEVLAARIVERASARGMRIAIVQVGHSQYSSRGLTQGLVDAVDLPGSLSENSVYRWFQTLRRLRTQTIVLFKGSVRNRAFTLDMACRLLGARYVILDAHFPDVTFPTHTPATFTGRLRAVARRVKHFLTYGMHSRAANHIVVLSDAVRQELIARYHYPTSISLVHLGVDSSHFSPSEELRRRQRAEWGIAEHDLVVGAVGRLDDVKRVDWALRAFARFKQLRPNRSAWFVLGGEGPARESLERLARELDIADRVKFLGWVPSSHAVNTALDIYVLPSRAEGFGIALIESMATGCACIATDSGGPGEILNDPSIGWLVPRDDETAFSNAVLEAMDLPPERLTEIGRDARASVVRRFDERKLSEDMLDDILGTSTAPAARARA